MSEPEIPFRWRRIIVPAYGPTLLVSIGQGAILPLIALSARDLGATVGQAALMVALLGVGQLIGDLPAGAVAARIGEQRALVIACVIDAGALVGAYRADSLVLLAAAMLVVGVAGAMFSLARQSYLAETVPIRFRARAMSTLGGTLRAGLLIGPFVAAGIVARSTIGAAYGFAAGMSVTAAVLTAFLPDVTKEQRLSASGPPRGVLSVLGDHRRLLVTLGTGVMVMMAARMTRQSLLPLWAESVGIDPSTTSIIFGISAAVEILLVYPGGAVMDRFGRVWVAVPAMIVLGLGFLLLPAATGPISVGGVAALMGLGNGLSAGIVMTLGADVSPTGSRAQFLAGWRVCADLGTATGPLLISAITAVAPLAAATIVMGLLAWAGSAWLLKWVPAYAARPRARTTRAEPGRAHPPPTGKEP